MKLRIINKGFTIIELLVVMAIVGIILGITIPRLSRSTDATKLKTTTESVKNLLEMAKSTAMTERVACAFTRGTDSQGNARAVLIKIDKYDIDNDGDTAELIQCDKGFEIPSGISINFTADNEVRFTPWGSVSNADGDVVISSGSLNKSRTISINQNTGYISVT